MASIVDSINEAFIDNLSFVKFAIYSIPIYFCIKFFLAGQMQSFYILGMLTLVLVLALITNGINSVRLSRNEILTLNPIRLTVAIFKMAVALVPQALVFFAIGHFLTTNINFNVDIAHFNLIVHVVIWTILGSILFTAFLSFAKNIEIKQAYNYKAILDSCIDVLLSCIFLVPQLLIANILIVGPVAYLFFLFHVPFTHWGFLVYVSLAAVVNISILSNSLAQISFEQIQANNKDYDENFKLHNVINDDF